MIAVHNVAFGITVFTNRRKYHLTLRLHQGNPMLGIDTIQNEVKTLVNSVNISERLTL